MSTYTLEEIIKNHHKLSSSIGRFRRVEWVGDGEGGKGVIKPPFACSRTLFKIHTSSTQVQTLSQNPQSAPELAKIMI